MHIVLIALHVTTLVASLVLMPAAIVLALRGVRQSLYMATTSFALTGLGFLSGILLLFDTPILSECIILTAYLFAMIAVYAWGFGWGYAPKARLLKTA